MSSPPTRGSVTTFGGDAGPDAGAVVVPVVVCVAVLYTTARIVWVDLAELDLCEDCPRELVEDFVHALTCKGADFYARRYPILRCPV
jgi:hypothetical protein